MTWLLPFLAVVGLLVGFVAGRVWQAWRVPRLLARLTPDQVRSLAARTAEHRRTTT